MKNYQVDHINITVPNLEESVTFYTRVLGFSLQARYKNGPMEFVFITNGNTVYELMENASLQASRMDHIAYVSQDIQADFAYFKEHHPHMLLTDVGYIDFLFENGVYFFFIQGAGQEKIEFCQKK